MNATLTTEPTLDDAVARVRADLKRGEYLAAYDLASEFLARWPDDSDLKHALVLTLARTGAVAQALAKFDDLGLHLVRNSETLSLKARLSKDLALPGGGVIVARHLADSISAYKEAYAVDPGYYPAINVATLCSLSNALDDTREWATRALREAVGKRDSDGYYAEATRAEALLLLRRIDDAREAIVHAAAMEDAGYGPLSTTRKQLRLICETQGIDSGILAPLTLPAILHFSGHIIAAEGKAGRFAADQEQEVAESLRDLFGTRRFSRAIGSLAAGADILAAEAALAAGVELVIVLPFGKEEFLDISVRPSGPQWERRFHACLERAQDVHFVTQDEWLEDDELFGYATEYALGLARLRAQWLDTEACQVSVWDGRSGTSASAGTTHDMQIGEAAAFRQVVIPVRSSLPCKPAEPPPLPDPVRPFRRERRSMIFGDLKGFSKLTDRQLPVYIDQVLGTIAEVLKAQQGSLRFSNTWGDGIFLVFDDLGAAADCAFALQDAVSAIDRAAHGLPDTLGLRLGFHYGPVYIARDPVLDRMNCFGFHVSRAARIEPITPEGSVYVTEQTAAALAIACPDDYRCDYVGQQPLAKGYGSFPMYHLQRLVNG
ncbi:tetratricopeptide repeat-containing protein [Minwuia sp.]|uniref:tetratricopeptide repeat-containing protein n=1 Tax=Minwuia sp. TaxID=2493630 RepID=UPI003A8D9795